jgi:hypothetical protein
MKTRTGGQGPSWAVEPLMMIMIVIMIVVAAERTTVKEVGVLLLRKT